MKSANKILLLGAGELGKEVVIAAKTVKVKLKSCDSPIEFLTNQYADFFVEENLVILPPLRT